MVDAAIQQELRARYNPDGSVVREHQMKLLEILKEFDAICRKHDIKYWLGAGTCLGAVRHGGFIPWDDDADVEMYYDDYLKFVRIFQSEYADSDYVIQNMDTDLYYTMIIAKFRTKKGSIREVGTGSDKNYKYKGPFVDIFPLERTTRFMSGIYKQRACYLHLFTKVENPGMVNRALLRFFKSIFKAKLRFFAAICRRLPWGKTRYCFGSIQYKMVFDPMDFENTVDMEFEGHMFKVPEGWDNYLRITYGDYMKFPPEEERTSDMHLVYE